MGRGGGMAAAVWWGGTKDLLCTDVLFNTVITKVPPGMHCRSDESHALPSALHLCKGVRRLWERCICRGLAGASCHPGSPTSGSASQRESRFFAREL